MAGRIVERARESTDRRVAGERLLTFLDAAERGADDHCEPRWRRRVRAQHGVRVELIGGRDQKAGGAAVGNALPASDARQLLDLAPTPDTQVADGEALDLRDS